SAPRTGRDLRGRPEPRHQQPLRARPPHPRAGLVDVLPELLAQPAHRRARDDLITAAAGDDPHSPRQQPSFADLTARRRTLSILPRRLTRLSCCRAVDQACHLQPSSKLSSLRARYVELALLTG